MTLIEIPQTIEENVDKLDDFISWLKQFISEGVPTMTEPCPFGMILRKEYNNDMVRIAFVIWLLTGLHDVLTFRVIPVVDFIYEVLPVFHIPEMYLRCITYKVVHDEEKQETTLIPCIDTDLLPNHAKNKIRTNEESNTDGN